MAVIKCKMCGGDIELAADKTFGTCEFCGSTMTLPKIDDDQRAAAFNRGNHFRRIGEFDKALAVYERIVREDDTDAEAHWCCALCRFGIEYVEDPATYEWLPTCHRASFDSFLEDVDYLAALEHSDGITRRQYQKDGAKIAEVQRGILATSQNEEPFDVFICYKESDENGERTKDSLMAQDIYYQLTDQGYRVFFSRITLEDMAGREYEPYIFAALNSAKVMIVVGTKPEYLNAVWVKNEWSRFLVMMKKDRHKLLLPCYRDMDPYDMPEQLAVLQSYDMGKIGFIQDLSRGISKVLNADKKPEPVKETVVVQQAAAPAGDTAALLKRVGIFLEDKDWKGADEYCEKVLDIDPENGQAYLYKTLAQEQCSTVDAFTRKRKDVHQNVSSERLHIELKSAHINEMVERFSMPGYVDASTIRDLYDFDLGYPSALPGRQKQYKSEEAYWAEHKLLSRAEKFAVGAVAENLQREKKALFAALSDRVKQAEAAEAAAKQDVEKRYEAHLKQADEKAEKNYNDGLPRREKHYQELLQIAKTSSNMLELSETAKKFDALGDYQDSKELAIHCRKRFSEEQSKFEAQREKEVKARAARNKKIAIVAAALLVLVIVTVAAVSILTRMNDYNKAMDLMEAGNYQEAIDAFVSLEGYKDSEKQILECRYKHAVASMDAGDYPEAIAVFKSLEGYKDSDEQILECEYKRALAFMDTGDYIDAIAIFKSLKGYKDSAAQINECRLGSEYQRAVVYKEAGYYTKAIAVFKSLEGYKDSDEQIDACNATVYDRAVAFKKDGNYRKALAEFDALDGYKDSAEQANALRVQLAVRDTISAGAWHTVGLKADGTVVAVGDNEYGQCNVAGWRDIIAISAGGHHTVGLKADGTVVAVGSIGKGQCYVQNWTDIIAISTGFGHTVGLKADGTVVAVGDNYWGQCNVSGWSDIIAISAGWHHTVGLKADGTVVAVGNNDYGQCNVAGWRDIIAISADRYHTVGLKTDGTVVAVGYNKCGQCNVAGWSDVIAISAGGEHTVGLKADGTVVAVGNNDDGQRNAKSWSDIVSISAGSDHTVGLKSDGTVVAVGDNDDGQRKVSGWKDIKIPETAE